MPEIRHFPLFRAFRAVLWAVPALVLAAGGAPPAVAKPLPPLSVMWHVDSSAPSGPAVHRVIVTLSAREDFDDLRVQIAVPEGLDLSEGPTEWRGPLARDAALTLPLVIRAPGPGHVSVAIDGQTASNMHFSRTITVDVPEPIEKPKAQDRPVAPEPGPTPGIREYPSR